MDSCDFTLNPELTEDQRAKFQSPELIQSLLHEAKTIAVVGLSTDPTKASHRVATYLRDAGYRIIPVHPTAEELLGERVYRSVADIPFPVDIVDIFRPANEVPAIVAQAIQNKAKSVWMQLRIISLVAAEHAHASGLKVVVDKCTKLEHDRYGDILLTSE